MWFGKKAKVVESEDVRQQKDFSEKLEAKVTSVVREILGKALSETETLIGRLKSSFDLAKHIADLRAELETLKIEKGRKEEEYARKDREIEHKIGLERKRQEFELSQSKREALVEVRETNLAAEKKRFEEQMKFHDDRFTTEVGYLKDMLKQMMERLPSASVKITQKSQ